MSTELLPCPWCGGEKTKDRRGPEYWIGRIEDCKYEPDKIFIYLGHLKKAIADANRRVPSRTEAEAVRLLMEMHGEGYDGDLPVTVGEFLHGLGMVGGDDWAPDDHAFCARYGEVDGDTSKPSTE